MLCFFVFRRPQHCLISPASVASSFFHFFKAQKVFSAKKNWTAWTPLEFLEFFDYWNSDWKFFENSPVLVGRLSISFPWLNSECLALLQPWRNRCLRAQPHEVWHEKIADWWRIPHWKTKDYISVSYLIFWIRLCEAEHGDTYLVMFETMQDIRNSTMEMKSINNQQYQENSQRTP